MTVQAVSEIPPTRPPLTSVPMDVADDELTRRPAVRQCGLTTPSRLRRPFNDWIIVVISDELALSRGKICPTDSSILLISSSAFCFS